MKKVVSNGIKLKKVVSDGIEKRGSFNKDYGLRSGWGRDGVAAVEGLVASGALSASNVRFFLAMYKNHKVKIGLDVIKGVADLGCEFDSLGLKVDKGFSLRVQNGGLDYLRELVGENKSGKVLDINESVVDNEVVVEDSGMKSEDLKVMKSTEKSRMVGVGDILNFPERRYSGECYDVRVFILSRKREDGHFRVSSKKVYVIYPDCSLSVEDVKKMLVGKVQLSKLKSCLICKVALTVEILMEFRCEFTARRVDRFDDVGCKSYLFGVRDVQGLAAAMYTQSSVEVMLIGDAGEWINNNPLISPLSST